MLQIINLFTAQCSPATLGLNFSLGNPEHLAEYCVCHISVTRKEVFSAYPPYKEDTSTEKEVI
jgi:hypothetical protein